MDCGRVLAATALLDWWGGGGGRVGGVEFWCLALFSSGGPMMLVDLFLSLEWRFCPNRGIFYT